MRPAVRSGLGALTAADKRAIFFGIVWGLAVSAIYLKTWRKW